MHASSAVGVKTQSLLVSPPLPEIVAALQESKSEAALQSPFNPHPLLRMAIPCSFQSKWPHFR